MTASMSTHRVRTEGLDGTTPLRVPPSPTAPWCVYARLGVGGVTQLSRGLTLDRGHAESSIVLGKRDDLFMARKNYSEEFRRRAVDLYESTPGATVRGIAEDLGIVRGTLRQWLEAFGTGKKTAADGTSTSSPLQHRPAVTDCGEETPVQTIERLQARVAELEVSEKKLITEREILQKAAKYFAGETRW